LLQETEFPEELDRSCRLSINDFFDRQRRLRRQKIAKIAAVVALVFLITCTTLVASVEAIRTPILRFLFCDKGTHSTFVLPHSETRKAFTPEETVSKARWESPLGDFLPENYSLTGCERTAADGFVCFYEDEMGQKIAFHVELVGGVYNIDTENAQVTNVKIFGHEGVLIVKNKSHILWVDAEAGLFYDLIVQGMEPEAALELAERIAQCRDWEIMLHEAA
jgi:hypothetical protein